MVLPGAMTPRGSEMPMQGSTRRLQTILPRQQMGTAVGAVLGVKQNWNPAHCPGTSDAVFTVQVMAMHDPGPTVMVVPLGGAKAPGGSVPEQPGTVAGVMVQR